MGEAGEEWLEEPDGAEDGYGFWSLLSQSLRSSPLSAFLLVWVTKSGKMKHHKGSCKKCWGRRKEGVKGRNVSREEIGGTE